MYDVYPHKVNAATNDLYVGSRQSLNKYTCRWEMSFINYERYTARPYRLEEDRDRECVKRLDVWQNRKDGIPNKPSGCRGHASFIDTEAAKALHHCIKTISDTKLALGNETTIPFKRTRSPAVNRAQKFGAQYA